MAPKIYSRTGDKGETSLIGGRRVSKDHEQIEAYGTVDELNSFIGLLRDQKIDGHTGNILGIVQERLFVVESLLAIDYENLKAFDLPLITEDDIVLLEKEIDEMNLQLPELKHFVLPGGHPFSSLAHVARTICRRAERNMIKLSHNYPLDPLCVKYINRLSDYLFVLARKLNHDNNVNDIPWIPVK